MASPPLLRPIVESWSAKLAAARESKKAFSEIAKQCEAFFSCDPGFMWEDKYRAKYLSGSLSTKFRLTLNRCFELVAIFGPSLYWRAPNRKITSYSPLEIPREIYPPDEEGENQYQEEVAQVER